MSELGRAGAGQALCLPLRFGKLLKELTRLDAAALGERFGRTLVCALRCNCKASDWLGQREDDSDNKRIF